MICNGSSVRTEFAVCLNPPLSHVVCVRLYGMGDITTSSIYGAGVNL
jgi:hypothetical protein